MSLLSNIIVLSFLIAHASYMHIVTEIEYVVFASPLEHMSYEVGGYILAKVFLDMQFL